jgi:hypothetical protein
MNRLILAATVTAFLVPASAFAGLVAYEYEGVDITGVWTVSGSIVFDEADLEANVDLIDRIDSWEFSWTNGSETFSVSSEGSEIVGGDGDNYGRPEPTFIIDASDTIVAFAFESGPELYPRIGFENNGGTFNIAVIPEFCCYQGYSSFSGPVPVPPTVVFVDVDIKPGSDGNCNAVIPVAVLGSDTFDATQIDVSTLSFAGTSAREKGNGALSCSTSDVNSDGVMDLVCQYQNATADGVVLGSLYDGTSIQGSDVYCVTP